MNLLNDKATKPAVAIEALNLLFDVYSDAAFDYDLPVFVQGAFLNNLKQVLPSIRSTVRKYIYPTFSIYESKKKKK